jgi:hypothetical protein
MRAGTEGVVTMIVGGKLIGSVMAKEREGWV